MPKPQSELPENQITPSPELEKRTRRRFSTEYKLRIIAEADQCAHGELGVLLRREGLYSSQLQQWRKHPYYITDPSQGEQDVLFFAGIYSGNAEAGFSVAILTEPAAPNLRPIHDRQPVVLDPESLYDWLDPDIVERTEIKRVTRRLDPERLDSWPVTPRMNRPDYEDSAIIEPVDGKLDA